MSKTEKEKGKRGEREVAEILRKHGFPGRRTAQYCGNTGDASDVVGIDGWHIEVKRVEKMNMQKAIDQATHDAGEKNWFVAHRKNRSPWYATLPLDTLLELIRDGKIRVEGSNG